MSSIVYITSPVSTAVTITTPVFDAEWSDAYESGATGLDSEISKDGGSFADCDNELTEIDSTGVYTLTVTDTERGTHDNVVIKCTTTTVGAKIPIFVIQTPVTDTNVISIANDVITAAAHDESTSYPLAAASSTLATEAELDKVPKSDGAVTWNATALASVQTVVDAAIDTIIPELGVAAPADTPTLRTGLMHLVMRAINESIMNNSTGYVSVANAAGTVISKQLVTDAAGVTTIDKSISG